MIRIQDFTLVNEPTWSITRVRDIGISAHYKQADFYITKESTLDTDLDHFGCYDDLVDVRELPVGEALALGFPQGEYSGVIITRIS